MFAWGRYTGPTSALDLPIDPSVMEPRLDRFGNPIEDAVNDYRIDVEGELYERHAPETFVGKPGPPVI
jgi:hypothetical protein